MRNVNSLGEGAEDHLNMRALRADIEKARPEVRAMIDLAQKMADDGDVEDVFEVLAMMQALYAPQDGARLAVFHKMVEALIEGGEGTVVGMVMVNRGSEKVHLHSAGAVIVATAERLAGPDASPEEMLLGELGRHTAHAYECAARGEMPRGADTKLN